ncbi:uncharacterized protein IWZ02DRAFT_270145 [Phyllosticta citriasiana]|uniref:Uncharacterized protein n=1 Tax=Phyllosticta citriasiana TaxID=595635 RepID=A0ABR1L149_9PEZI
MLFGIKKEVKSLQWKPNEPTKRATESDRAVQLKESVEHRAAQLPALHAALESRSKKNEKSEGMSEDARKCEGCDLRFEKQEYDVGDKRGRQKLSERKKSDTVDVARSESSSREQSSAVPAVPREKLSVIIAASGEQSSAAAATPNEQPSATTTTLGELLSISNVFLFSPTVAERAITPTVALPAGLVVPRRTRLTQRSRRSGSSKPKKKQHEEGIVCRNSCQLSKRTSCQAA